MWLFGEIFSCHLPFRPQVHLHIISHVLHEFPKDAAIHDSKKCFLKIIIQLSLFLCVTIDVWFKPWPLDKQYNFMILRYLIPKTY